MSSIETGCPYYVYMPGSGGPAASMNLVTDPNFVGYITEVTGLDMYGVRENAGAMTAGDGGYHGPFWRDRRPFTITGFFMPTQPLASRFVAMDKLLAVVGAAFRADAVLNWQPLADNVMRGVTFRTQQPLRISDGQSKQQKMFTLAGVARDWRILKWTNSNSQVTGPTPRSVTLTQTGNADAAPLITITGPVTNPVITETVTGKRMSFIGSVPAGQQLVINLQGTYPSILLNGSDWSNNVDPLNSDYTIAVIPVSATFQLTGSGSSAATALRVQWNDSWH